MKRFAILTLASLLFSSAAFAVEENLPAFPGAEGYGRYVTGGRGGDVYHVTTLDDDVSNPPEGSFRWACNKSGARTIVFDVSGTIMLKGELKLRNGNVTIAGQTAPGDGVCIANFPFVISAPNTIIRFMRFRLGNEAIKLDNKAHEGDGLGGMDGRNIMVDHCSVSWSIDECLSVYGSHDITVQWCIASHSLVNAGHSKGSHGYGGNWGGSGASYHHNFVTNHTSRTPRLGPRPGTQKDERMDLRNNVIYNFGGNGIYGGEGMNVNIVNNYFKPGKGTGSGTKGMRIAKIDARTFDYCFDKSAFINDLYKTTGISGIPANNISVRVNTDASIDIRVPVPKTDDAAARTVYCPVNMDAMTCDFEGTAVKITGNSWWPMVHKYGTFFVDGNVNTKYPTVTEDNWANGIYNQMGSTECDRVYPGENNVVKDGLKRQAPLEYVYTTTHSAEEAYDRVLEYVGACLHRDEYDAMLVDECREGKTLFTSNGFINSQDDVKYADGSTGWPKLESKPALADTDGDGIPDEWESKNGLNPDNAADGKEVGESGYTHLEEYMNSLVAHIMEGGNAGGKLLTGTEVFDENSAIDDIVVDSSERPSDGRIYNLMGVEVHEPLAPGIYIRDGKKFIAR